MKELEKKLVAKIKKQLKSDNPNIELLDMLNRLLGTVSHCLVR